MPNKEVDEMREQIAELLCNKKHPWEDSFWAEKASEPYKIGYYFIADQILAKEISNGYSIQQMIKFFRKIKCDTQREAIVRKEAELPKNTWHDPVLKHTCSQTQQDMLAKHFKQEVVEDG